MRQGYFVAGNGVILPWWFKLWQNQTSITVLCLFSGAGPLAGTKKYLEIFCISPVPPSSATNHNLTKSLYCFSLLCFVQTLRQLIFSLPQIVITKLHHDISKSHNINYGLFLSQGQKLLSPLMSMFQIQLVPYREDCGYHRFCSYLYYEGSQWHLQSGGQEDYAYYYHQYNI